MNVQVVGLQRSGTNWIQELIGCNFDVTVLYGYKHFMPDELESDADVYVIIKKRLDHWLNSVFRWGVDLKKMRGELYDRDELRLPDAAALWSHFHDVWMEHKPGALHITYEDTLANPVSFLGAFASHAKTPSRGTWIIPERVHLSVPMTENRRDYYLDQGEFVRGRQEAHNAVARPGR